ncbi:hypothetical protein [Novipirellula sp.]|uniref:hypothetical protein n=1 Tax=Novipirellula sp. TaxID=2795430 RepID=UPI0035669655
MATRQEVSQFLSEVAAAILLGHVQWITRAETTQGLLDLGINQSIAHELIQNLTPDNYSTGPEPDRNCPGRDVWIFGVTVNSLEAYVKLALQKHNRKKTVVVAIVWSFHPAKHKLIYPLATDGQQNKTN